MGIQERRRVPTIHADGFDDFFLVNGILRCTAFVLVKSSFETTSAGTSARAPLESGSAGAAEAQLEVQRLLEQQSGEGFRLMRSEAAH
jgi:hypothetical protein